MEHQKEVPDFLPGASRKTVPGIKTAGKLEKMPAIRPEDYQEKAPDSLMAAQRETNAGHKTAAQQEMTPGDGRTGGRVQTDAKKAGGR